MSAVSGVITPETADKGIGRIGSPCMPGQTLRTGHVFVMSALRARHAENSRYPEPHNPSVPVNSSASIVCGPMTPRSAGIA
jgi:hypothetical protein